MKLEYLLIHCTDTPKDMDVQRSHIEQWHLVENGWSKMGYTDLIVRSGDLVNLTPYDQDDEVDGFEITNGARGVNSISRHIALAGGKTDVLVHPNDLFSFGQMETLEVYIKFMLKRHPHLKVGGHNQFSSKNCPGFDVPDYLESIGIHKANIHC